MPLIISLNAACGFRVAMMTIDLLSCTCDGIRPGRVGPASPLELITSQAEALQGRRPYASSLGVLDGWCNPLNIPDVVMVVSYTGNVKLMIES